MRNSSTAHRSSCVLLLIVLVIVGCRTGRQQSYHRSQSPVMAPQSAPEAVPSPPSVPPPYDDNFPQLINPNNGGNSPVIVPEPEGAARSQKMGPVASSMPDLSESPRFAGRRLRKRRQTVSVPGGAQPVVASAAAYPPVGLPEPVLEVPDGQEAAPAHPQPSIAAADPWTPPLTPSLPVSRQVPAQNLAAAVGMPQPSPALQVGTQPGEPVRSVTQPLPWSASPAAQSAPPALVALPNESTPVEQELVQPALLPGPSLFAAPPSNDDSEPQYVRPTTNNELGNYFHKNGATPIGVEKASLNEIAVCSAVRGVRDFDSLNAQRLAAGQEILVYAELENFRCELTPSGYRTYTYSSLEIRLPDGRPIVREPLGTATDVASKIRREQYLTHQIRLPGQLTPGKYTLHLTILDLNSQQRTETDLAIEIQ